MQSGKNLSKFRWLISHSFPHLNSESRVSPNAGSFLPDEMTSYQKRQSVQIPRRINSKLVIWYVSFFIVPETELYNFSR